MHTLMQAGGTIRETETEVLVASIGGGMQPRRMEIAAQLWAAGIKVRVGVRAGRGGWRVRLLGGL